MVYSREDYEKEPVYYCTLCLSLNIQEVPKVEDLYICVECGNTDIKTTDMEAWTVLYSSEYGSIFMKGEGLKFEKEELD